MMVVGGSHLAKPQGRFGSSHSANLDSAYYIGRAPVLCPSKLVQYISFAKINSVEPLVVCTKQCTIITIPVET